MADQDGPQAAAEDSRDRFLKDLRALRGQSGVSIRAIAEMTRYSPSTIGNVNSCTLLPREPMTRAIVGAVGASPEEVEQWVKRCRDLRLRLGMHVEPSKDSSQETPSDDRAPEGEPQSLVEADDINAQASVEPETATGTDAVQGAPSSDPPASESPTKDREQSAKPGNAGAQIPAGFETATALVAAQETPSLDQSALSTSVGGTHQTRPRLAVVRTRVAVGVLVGLLAVGGVAWAEFPSETPGTDAVSPTGLATATAPSAGTGGSVSTTAPASTPPATPASSTSPQTEPSSTPVETAAPPLEPPPAASPPEPPIAVDPPSQPVEPPRDIASPVQPTPPPPPLPPPPIDSPAVAPITAAPIPEPAVPLCPGEACEGQSPFNAADCSTGHENVTPIVAIDASDGTPIAVLSVAASAKCGTRWAKVATADGADRRITVELVTNDSRTVVSDETDDFTYTTMLSDRPGLCFVGKAHVYPRQGGQPWVAQTESTC